MNNTRTIKEVEVDFMKTLVKMAERKDVVLTERQKKVLPKLALKTSALYPTKSEQIIQISSALCSKDVLKNVQSIDNQVKVFTLSMR